MIELIGYLGSALVVASMLMSSVVKLRVINTIGSGVFTAYALMIHSYPTALMNAALIAINVYNLIKLNRRDQSYDLVEGAWGEGILRYLLDYYREDIQTYFPDFQLIAERIVLILSAATEIRRVCCWELTAARERCGCCWTTPRPPTATAPSGPICTPSCPPGGSTPWSSRERQPKPTPLI